MILKQTVLSIVLLAHKFDVSDCSAPILSPVSQSILVTSFAAFEFGCAEVNTPLRLRVGQGQRMNISVFNFNTGQTGNNFEILDPVSGAKVQIDSSLRYQRGLMTSLSNEVDVIFEDERANVALEITGTKLD